MDTGRRRRRARARLGECIASLEGTAVGQHIGRRAECRSRSRGLASAWSCGRRTSNEQSANRHSLCAEAIRAKLMDEAFSPPSEISNSFACLVVSSWGPESSGPPDRAIARLKQTGVCGLLRRLSGCLHVRSCASPATPSPSTRGALHRRAQVFHRCCARRRGSSLNEWIVGAICRP